MNIYDEPPKEKEVLYLYPNETQPSAPNAFAPPNTNVLYQMLPKVQPDIKEMQHSTYVFDALSKCMTNNAEDKTRIQSIVNWEKFLKSEMAIQRNIYNNRNRIINGLIGTATGMITASVALSTAGISAIFTVAGTVVGVPCVGTGIAVLGLSYPVLGIILALKRKHKKHLELYKLAQSKLDTIVDHVRSAVKDSRISLAEYEFIESEMKKYHAMKSETRGKVSSVNIDQRLKEQFIQQGKKEKSLEIMNVFTN